MLDLIRTRIATLPLPVSAREQKYSVNLVFSLIDFEVKLQGGQYNQRSCLGCAALKYPTKLSPVRA